MTPAKDVRSLIEEARDSIFAISDSINNSLFDDSIKKLDQALALLPGWQEFDPKREETWPKEAGFYAVTLKDHPDSQADWWDNTRWNDNLYENVLAYQPLPPPYVKK